jgi:N-acetylneuraminate synthase/N,N'-diacetyllegionaminate synthase
MRRIKISNKYVGENEPCFIIAEAGINHNGDINIAKKMIDIAKDCGVDAVKFQTFTAKNFIRGKKETYEYKSQGKKVKESMLKMFQRHEFKRSEWEEIAAYCRKKKIIFFSTPQDTENLNLLLEIGIPAIKVGSDDLINSPLLEEYSKKGLPMLISTGMAYMSEIDEAVKIIKKYNNELIIFHCVSSYPTNFDELNLNVIKTLQTNYSDCIIGFSDHSEGTVAAIISTALGSKVFEKHFTLDKNMKGPDHRFSADPSELKEIVKKIRTTELYLGSPDKKPTAKEIKIRKIAHRSIVAIIDILKGEVLTKENLSFKRPGTGLPPKLIKNILGKKAKKNIKKNEIINLSDISE